VINNKYYHTIFTGGVISAGDWVVWLPTSHVSGATACQGAAAVAASPTYNDFIHNQDVNDHPDHYDRGGLVRSADIDGDSSADLFAEIQLAGGTDGRTDPDLYNNNAGDLTGSEDPSSTYYMCLADASANGHTYSAGNPPGTDSAFTQHAHVKIHVQVCYSSYPLA